jgi:peroxiredoxin
MRTFTVSLLAISAMLVGHAFSFQDKPVMLEKSELPVAAKCAVCETNGVGHGEGKIVAGARYKGQTLYFCDSKEIGEFKTDPEAFLPPVLPRPAPVFKVKSLNGQQITLAGIKSKATLVDFWATWCKPCVESMPDLQQLHESLGSKGLKVLGISLDEGSAKSVKSFAEKHKITYSLAMSNDEAVKSYKIRVIPALFLIDKEGHIVRQWAGKPYKKEVEEAVSSLLKEAK